MDSVDLYFSNCFEGNCFAVEIYLKKGISPDVQNAEGETGLQIAAACGYLDLVSLLLNKGASVDLPNNYGWTPLMHAARHGNSEVVSLLIQMKAKVNVCNRLGLRPIDMAAWSGNMSCVQSVIDAGAIIDNLSNSENDLCDISPLMAASLQGHDFVVRTLLKNGSVANQASSITGLTPLMLAACNGHKSIAEILVEFGSNVNVMNICSQTALDLATICCREDVIIFLEDLTQQSTKTSNDAIPLAINILQVVRSGDISKLKSLLQKNRSLSNYSQPDDGVTPLMIACMLGLADIVDLLISSGADLNAQDVANGWTPLMYAVFHRQAEIVHLLLDKGVDIDICTFNGYTALDLAIHADSSGTDILETLLAYSGTADLLDAGDYLTVSTTSATKKSSSTFERTPSRNDSQARFKDLLGGLSSHLRQFSRSSVASTTVDQDVFDETLTDVFPDDDVQGASNKEKFLCLSKFYSPNERFAHLLKEQEVEAIILPPLPNHVDPTTLLKTVIPKKDKSGKSSNSKPRYNSLCTPNLIKGYWKKHFPGSTLKYPTDLTLKAFKEKRNYENPEFEKHATSDGTVTETCATEGLTVSNQESVKRPAEKSTNDQHPTQSISTMKGGTAEGLTALLNEESLKKYAEKFRDQEVQEKRIKNKIIIRKEICKLSNMPVLYIAV